MRITPAQYTTETPVSRTHISNSKLGLAKIFRSASEKFAETVTDFSPLAQGTHVLLERAVL